MDSNEITVAIVVGDDALKKSFAGAVDQRPPSGEDLARRSEARVVQEAAIKLRDDETVEVVIRSPLSTRTWTRLLQSLALL